MDSTNRNPQAEPVAVIGMAGRFPGARSTEQFWENLAGGVESISFYTHDQLRDAGISAEQRLGPDYVKAGADLQDVDRFDPDFFGMSVRDAELTDPQQRMMLEIAWEACEHAGYDTTQRMDVGVFVGARMNSYLLNNLAAHCRTADLVDSYQFIIASDRDYLATRVSQFMGLTGPSLTVQAACATSLLAVHLACRSLLNRECQMALAGAVCVRVPHTAGYQYKPAGIRSPDGHTRTFDARAGGTVLGSGAGVVLLKRLDEALRDGDHIHAVIKGSAANNNGRTPGITAPSVDGQAEVIARALEVAEVEPQRIGYVEAHGTGTAKGDPVEVAALTRAFRASTSQKTFCAMGSIKPNVGHLDVASGVAGLIKTVLSLEHECIPPTLHFEHANPQLDLPNSPFFVNTERLAWPRGAAPRHAGVSSFGFGGTNVHVVLEEAPLVAQRPPSRPWNVVPLSAKSPLALEAATHNLREHLQQKPELRLDDVAVTLQTGRTPMAHRRAVACQSLEHAVELLGRDECRHEGRALESPQVAFMFPGHGSQYLHMTRQIYDSEPVYRSHVDACANEFEPHLGLDIRTVMFPPAGEEERATDQLLEQCLTPIALFTVEYSMAKLWMHWGVCPAVMIGYSVGEYVAACLSGLMSFPHAVEMVAVRTNLLKSQPRGSMLAVALTEQDIKPLLSDQISLCAVSAPAHCVLGGAVEAVDTLQKSLEREDIACRRLHVSHAFHSAMVEPILGQWRDTVCRMHFERPKIDYVSSVTGDWFGKSDVTDPEFWVREVRQPVLFSSGVAMLADEPERIFLEVGPGNMLARLVKGHPAVSRSQLVLSSGRHAKDPSADGQCLYGALARLWTAGVDIDWSQLYPDAKPQRVALPTYPFQRRRCWIDAAPRNDEVRQSPLETVGIQQSPVSTPKKVSMLEWDIAATGSAASPTAATQDTNSPAAAECVESDMNPLECEVAALWVQLLGDCKITARDSFFELGGNSLIAVQLISRVRSAFGVDMPLAHFLMHPTVAYLADAIAKLQADGAADVDQILDEITQPPATPVRCETQRLEEYSLSKVTRRASEVSASIAHTSGSGKNADRPGSTSEARQCKVDSPVRDNAPQRALDFSLFFFSGDESAGSANKYELVIAGAQFADKNGFAAVWTPERHFHRFGGLYPNPSLLAAALATITDRIALRAGSAVAALHHPLRIAEEWSVVDNLSGGRAGLGLAAGFHPNDFVFAPDCFASRRKKMLESLETIRTLWRGEPIAQKNGAGANVEISLYPKPVQASLPIWLPTGGKPQTFIDAAEHGANVLTALLFLTMDELADRIVLYRRRLSERGYDPREGKVTVMLHTLVADSDAAAERAARDPLRGYMNQHFELIMPMAKQQGIEIDPEHLSAADRNALIDFAVDRYWQGHSLCGSVDTCLATARRLREIGVDEIACLVDFGVEDCAVMEGLQRICELKQRMLEPTPQERASMARSESCET